MISMTISNFLADKVCSDCGMSRFKVISDAVTLHYAPVEKQEVLKCLGCGACKTSGLVEDEKHASYHESHVEPADSKIDINFRGYA